MLFAHTYISNIVYMYICMTCSYIKLLLSTFIICLVMIGINLSFFFKYMHPLQLILPVISGDIGRVKRRRTFYSSRNQTSHSLAAMNLSHTSYTMK